MSGRAAGPGRGSTGAATRRAGELPLPGQVVLLADAAGAEFRDGRAVWLLLSTAPEASSVDLLRGRTADTAERVLLTGWQVDEDGRHLGRRYLRVPARRGGIEVVAP